MNTDIYKTWEPLEDLPNNFNFYNINNIGSDLIVLLKAPQFQKVLQIKFTGALAYRVVQEAYRLKALYENSSLIGFETSTDSEFLKWLREEGDGVLDDWELKHYVICNSDNIIDVISGPPVEAEWISL